MPRENRRETTQRFNLLPVTRNVKGKGRYRKKKMRVYRTRREGNALYNGEDKAKRSERMWEVIGKGWREVARIGEGGECSELGKGWINALVLNLFRPLPQMPSFERFAQTRSSG